MALAVRHCSLAFSSRSSPLVLFTTYRDFSIKTAILSIKSITIVFLRMVQRSPILPLVSSDMVVFAPLP